MEKLNLPQDFISTAGVQTRPALLTPSHFTTVAPESCTANQAPTPIRTLAPPPTQAPPPDPWILLTHTQQELQELRRDRQREERERQRLSEELRERDRNFSRQTAELVRYKEELNQYRLKCERSDRDLQRCEEETQQVKEQLEQVCESHSAEISALTQNNTHLQNTLTTSTQEVMSLRQRVEEVTSEKEKMQEELRSVIAEQADTLQKLRSYIGTHTKEEEHHTLIQKLQEEKDSLGVCVELLKVRVQAANDILTLQERELREECDPLHQDSRAGQLLGVWREKVFKLLVQLRTKDLHTHNNSAQLHNTVCDLKQEVQKLQSQISVLQHNLQDKTAQLQLHNLQTQELQQQLCSAVEENQKLKEQNENNKKSIRDLTDTAHRVCESVGQCDGQVEAAQVKMTSLSQRLNFATKRLDTVHGLFLRREALRKAQQATKPPEPPATQSCIDRLQTEVELLSSERDRLTQELKRTPELIQNSLRDLQQQLDREVGLLTQALSRSRSELAECELRRLEAERQCGEQEETIAELRAEAHRIQQHCDEQEGTIAELREEALQIEKHYQSLVQEKVAEVESVCAKQLREMESQLNTARREHTKAVVALRQVERTAQREREQEREAERARSEHTHKHITQLHTQLKNKDKEHNILLAVVQQQGLMNEYKRMRRAAIQSPKPQQHAQHQQQHTQHQQQHTQHQQQHTQHQHQHCTQKKSQEAVAGEQQEDVVRSVLGEVRSLSSAVIHSSEEEEDDDEEGQKD